MHTLGLSFNQTYYPMWFFTPPSSSFISFLCQPPPTRRKETSCSRATPSTRALSMNHQSRRPTASSSVDAAKSECGRRGASLHCSPPQALKLSFQNPFSTALSHSAYRATEREQNLIMVRTKVAQRPRCI